MNIKMWLMRGWKLNSLINQLLEQKQRAYDMACKVTAKLDGDRVQSGGGNSSEDKLIRLADYTRRIDNMVDELYKVKQEILQAIDKLDNSTYKTLLIARYINFKTWEQIAVDMSYSYVHVVYNLHGQSLKEIEKVNSI